MLRITCPWCGPRDEPEFRWGGEAIVRPGPPETVSDEDWAEYLFMRDNLKDFTCERWLHALGCRQWFIVVRSTVTHEIRSTAKLSEASRRSTLAG
jgi:heterotetrameric sarcosine oxidase delta subunit